jgi:hypothetical protein
MKSIASLGELELEGRKTNHSTRKTFATDLESKILMSADFLYLLACDLSKS